MDQPGFRFFGNLGQVVMVAGVCYVTTVVGQRSLLELSSLMGFFAPLFCPSSTEINPLLEGIYGPRSIEEAIMELAKDFEFNSGYLPGQPLPPINFWESMKKLMNVFKMIKNLVEEKEDIENCKELTIRASSIRSLFETVYGPLRFPPPSQDQLYVIKDRGILRHLRDLIPDAAKSASRIETFINKMVEDEIDQDDDSELFTQYYIHLSRESGVEPNLDPLLEPVERIDEEDKYPDSTTDYRVKVEKDEEGENEEPPWDGTMTIGDFKVKIRMDTKLLNKRANQLKTPFIELSIVLNYLVSAEFQQSQVSPLSSYFGFR